MNGINDLIKRLRIIHFSLIVWLVLAYAVLADLTYFTTDAFSQIQEDILLSIAIPIAAYLISNIVFRLSIKKLKSLPTDNEKIKVYTSAHIFRMAILEGGAFIILIVMPELVLLGVTLIIYMLLLFPTKYKISREINLNNE